MNAEQNLRGYWVKSSYSGPSGGDCVEVAAAPTVMHVRDSKLPEFASLAFPAIRWAALTDSIRDTA
ncbi:DUF397 domain-containing protein [Yinghuangia sp. ASG 101]|uniref:DUF397 domain-containing protein n=1 Tax=Yinghuangia sp. ASG 101 TaxID=2896848 RepID=UPI001E472250|nr:DUF397 domain-containing protein [Yinghuangia sp. ASG 101]UGQ12799.1 DUF397 domain-containing protein [Yinghuangia sp. ASG 101]